MKPVNTWNRSYSQWECKKWSKIKASNKNSSLEISNKSRKSYLTGRFGIKSAKHNKRYMRDNKIYFRMKKRSKRSKKLPKTNKKRKKIKPNKLILKERKSNSISNNHRSWQATLLGAKLSFLFNKLVTRLASKNQTRKCLCRYSLPQKLTILWS